jgi:hypothetical protein
MLKYLVAFINGSLLEALYDIIITAFVAERQAINYNRDLIQFDRTENQ